MKREGIILITLIVIVIISGLAYFLKPKSEFDLNLPKPKNMKIISSEFQNNEYIPKKYSCEGENVNPPLEFKQVPESAKSLALIVDDPDAPSGVWTHWLLWNIDPRTAVVGENGTPQNAVIGLNTAGNNKYSGPCPPFGTHRYFFKLYALDQNLELSASSTKADLEKAMSGHIIDWSELKGLYKK